jgi:Domain of unknown function (DUF222)
MLDALATELSGEFSQRSNGIPDESLARRLGEKSAAAAVASVAGVDFTEARDWCLAGEALADRVNLQGESLPDKYPDVAALMRRGMLSPRKARAIIEAIDKVSMRATPEQLCDLENLLAEHSLHLSNRDLERVCKQVIDRFDPDGVEPREDDLRARSGVQIIHGRDGLITWILKMHPEAAGFMTAALDARTAPRRQPSFTPMHESADENADESAEPITDDRTLAQQRLDALVSIARESLAHDNGQLAGTAVTMNVTMSLESLLSGLGTAQIDGIDEPISAKTARRLACDAQIIPIVLDGRSEPLDLGHGQRLFSEGQRRALATRDGGCIWPRCSAPPGWCEVAHLKAWALGGRTDLKNGALMCPFHHRRFDHDGWEIEWENGVPYLIPPPWVDPARSRRRAGRLPRAA